MMRGDRRFSATFQRVIVEITAVSALFACSTHSGSNGLVGHWVLNGAPDRRAVDAAWTAVDFQDTTHVTITALPGDLATETIAHPRDKPLVESSTYKDMGNDVVRIGDDGAQTQDYKMRIEGDKLFVTMVPNAADAQVGGSEPTHVFVRKTQ